MTSIKWWTGAMFWRISLCHLAAISRAVNDTGIRRISLNLDNVRTYFWFFCLGDFCELPWALLLLLCLLIHSSNANSTSERRFGNFVKLITSFNVVNVHSSLFLQNQMNNEHIIPPIFFLSLFLLRELLKEFCDCPWFHDHKQF